MSKNTNITEMPYAKWLEQSLRDISVFPIRGIALAATTEDGETYINYYNIPMADKLVLAGLIQQDATLDMMAANGIIEHQDDDSDEEEDGNGEEEE